MVVGSQQRPLHAAFTSSATGAAQISGSMQLDLSLSPTIVQPGDTIELLLTLSNPGQMTQMPTITLQLPNNLVASSRALPSGMTMNVATNALSWLPIVSANGGLQQFVLQFRAVTADILTPEQAITAVTHLNGETYTASAGFWLGIPPQIETILAPSQVTIGQPFALNIETTGSGPIQQSWHFGDGRQAMVNNPTIIYPMAGIYQITVNAANPLTAVSATKTITVVPHPAAQFSTSDLTLSPHQPLHLINESGGQPPLSYQWDFGDGVTSTAANPEHIYTAPGVYQVHLEVENAYGRSDAFAVVSVGQPPIADIILPASVPANEPFSAQAFGDESVTHFVWNLGDGHRQEGAQISHTFRQSGDFYVVMTANNEFGGSDVGRWIHVDLGQFMQYLPLFIRSVVLNSSTVTINRLFDEGVGISLPDVALEVPFVIRPLPLPASMTQAEQLYVYINEARTQFDLPPLTLIPQLNTTAQQHTIDMATYGYTAHVGSDGSTPAERFIWHQYSAGYAGEATAWGFEYPHQAVEFWINSPAHRRIILNEFATDLGVGFTRDFNAPNVWYWTAEFGNAYLSPNLPMMRLRAPNPELEFMNTDRIAFAWNWPQPLAPGEEFVVTLLVDGDEIELGRTVTPRLGTYYVLETDIATFTKVVGLAEWFVTLRRGVTALSETETRPLILLLDPDLPTPTPDITAVPPLLTPIPTVTPTPQPILPNATQPANPSPPLLLTATPNP